jgi:hypothetical protein
MCVGESPNYINLPKRYSVTATVEVDRENMLVAPLREMAVKRRVRISRRPAPRECLK